MKSKRIFVTAILLIFAFSSLCYAGELSAVVNERTLSIDGTCGSGNENATVIVVPSDVTLEELDSLEGDLLSKVFYMGRAAVTDGVLKAEIPLPERMESEAYKVFVIGASETCQKEFVFKNPADIIILFETLSATEDEEEFFEGIIENAAELGIRSDEFEKITGEAARRSLMLNIQNNMKIQEGTPAGKLRNAFYLVVTEFLMEGEFSGEELKLWSGHYFKNAGIDETYINKIIEEELENELAERIENGEYGSIADISEKLMLESFLVRFAESETKGLRYSVYEEYGKEKLNLSSGIFGGYSEKTVLDNFTTNKFSDMSGFENEIRKSVSALKNASKPSGGGGGGGGGASSGKIEYTPSESEKAPENKPIVEAKYEFTDMGDYGWAKESVEKLLEKGVISKAENKKFRPSDFVTREEFIKMLVTALDVKADGDISFSDVTENMWCYSVIKTGYAAGLIKGISEECFGTGRNITRQDIAVILERAIAKYEIETAKVTPAKTFTDENEISDYAREAVKLMGESGIINGYEDGSFRPSGFATRAETAVLISKIIK